MVIENAIEKALIYERCGSNNIANFDLIGYQVLQGHITLICIHKMTDVSVLLTKLILILFRIMVIIL